MRKTDIVVTTIFEPAWLQGYLDDIRYHGQESDVTLRIIVDRKTPESVFDAAEKARKAGFLIDCPNLEEQESYLTKLGISDSFIPWNSDNRRNIGFLRAWESGADVLISIDDDNYCLSGSNFVGSHHVVGSTTADVKGASLAAGGSWYNICKQLKAQISDDFYARGFPYSARRPQAQAELTSLLGEVRRISVNAGLWTDDPDVDAMSRLVQAPRVHSADPSSVILAPETWSPINTQNTSLIREAIPAYYYVRMGFPIQGMKIDRFGDILSGYFLQKCAKHLGDVVRIGDPVAEHRRSPHNLFKDLFHELAGMVVVEELLPWLQNLELQGDNYIQAYSSLADALTSAAGTFSGFVWDEGGRDFLLETADCMRTWLQVIDQIDGVSR